MAQKTQSKYAAKLASGKMMYGGRGSESCCAHRITDAQLAAARARARQSQETRSTEAEVRDSDVDAVGK